MMALARSRLLTRLSSRRLSAVFDDALLPVKATCSQWYSGCNETMKMQVRSLQSVPRPPRFDHIVYPPGDGKLPEMPTMPIFDLERGEREHKTTKRMIEIRGPEWVHTELIHKQFGVVALTGGMLTEDHFELMRAIVNRHVAPSAKRSVGGRRFAVWRVEAPWLPFTKRKPGTKLGGGKPKIRKYITPVRSCMVLLEVGGALLEEQAQAFLAEVAYMCPFKAKFVTADELQAERAERLRIAASNVNRFSMDFILKWNMLNCSAQLSPYEGAWRGKFR